MVNWIGICTAAAGYLKQGRPLKLVPQGLDLCLKLPSLS
jgi:hypothetical protein